MGKIVVVVKKYHDLVESEKAGKRVEFEVGEALAVDDERAKVLISAGVCKELSEEMVTMSKDDEVTLKAEEESPEEPVDLETEDELSVKPKTSAKNKKGDKK